MKKSKKMGLLFYIFISSLTFVNAEAIDCKDTSIRKVTRPYYSNKPSSPTFEYSYRWINIDRSKPVFIYIPGGPGQTSIRQVPGWLEKENTILTDPRGVGCNEQNPDSTPDEFYTSAEIANDIIGMIRQEKIENYVLYGTSFGTMVATMIASKVSHDSSIAKPKSILLEGIMGRASHGQEWEQNVSTQWLKLKKDLPDNIRSKIDADEWPVPVTPEDMGEGVSQWLTLGKGMLSSILTGLFNSTEKKQQEEIIKNFFHYNPQSLPPNFVKVHRNISCREFSNEQSAPDEPRLLVKGQLVPGKKTYCSGIAYSNPYDAGNWLVEAPIFYFVGENDPATPVWQAEYHFTKQTKTARFLTIIGEGAGHAPLSATLYFADGCGKKVLESVATADFETVNSALKTCKTPSKVVSTVKHAPH